MQHCGTCGTSVADGVKFCPTCGAAMGTAQPAQQQQAQQQQPNNFQNIMNTPNATGGFAANDIEQNKIMAVLAYFGPLVFIPMFAAPNSPFARYHANQGLILFIAEIGWGIVTVILSIVLTSIASILGFIFSLLSPLVSLAIGILAIIGIINAVKGKAKELPLIGKFKILK